MPVLSSRLVRGRDFGDADRDGAPGVAIVNQELARRLWPGRDAIGQRIAQPAWSGAPREPLEVVGVVADSKVRSLTEPAPPMPYVPFSQHYDGRATIVVRGGEPATALADLRRVIAELDPLVPAYGAATMARLVEASVWRRRMVAVWVIAFGAVALALGAVGLYGVVAQSVAQRTPRCGPTPPWGAVADPFRISGSAASLASVPMHSPPVSFSSAARAWLMHQ